MRRLLLILLIIAPILGYAAGMGPGPGVKSYNSEQSSGEDDLVLAGDTTDRSGGSDYFQSAENALVYCYPGGDGYNGTSGTLRYGYLRTAGDLTASNIKMVVYTKSGSTWSLLETSTARSFAENSLIEFAFSGTKQIPSGTGNVIIGWIADGYCKVKTSGISWQMVNNTSGTYASPPGTIAPDDDPDSADALMEIFVTNYQR
jgi:hypothetical protein